MSKVVTFGEIMMRLNPEGYLRFLQADRFEVTYAGGEANVAVSLANYGKEARFVTGLPRNKEWPLLNHNSKSLSSAMTLIRPMRNTL